MDKVETPNLTVKLSSELLDEMIARCVRLSGFEYPAGVKIELFRLEDFLKAMKASAENGA